MQLPDFILHRKAGAISQLKLDLNAAASTCVSRSACIDFVLRRQTHGVLSGSLACTQLALGMLKVRCGLVQPAMLACIWRLRSCALVSTARRHSSRGYSQCRSPLRCGIEHIFSWVR